MIYFLPLRLVFSFDERLDCNLPTTRGKKATSWLYVKEKLLEAMEIITGKESIRNRVILAAAYLTRLKIADISDKNHADFAAAMNTLTKYPAKNDGEGAIRASVRRLRNEEPAALARKIMSIYVDVSCAARTL